MMASNVDINTSFILLMKKKATDIDDIDWFKNNQPTQSIDYHINHNHNYNNYNNYNYHNNHNNINNNSHENSHEDTILNIVEYVGNLLYFYYVPVIVLIGSFGNMLSVMVFFKNMKLRKLSSSYYLSALAISDTCFLFGLLMQWLNFIDINIYNRHHFCQFFTYFSNLACFCSSWFVVGFTVERFIAIMYPLKRQHMCTIRRAKIVLITLSSFGVIHCVPFWIASTPAYSQRLDMIICDIKIDYKIYIQLLNYWDTLVVYAIPFIIIAILNTFTGYQVWRFATIRLTLTTTKTTSGSNQELSKRKHFDEEKLTKETSFNLKGMRKSVETENISFSDDEIRYYNKRKQQQQQGPAENQERQMKLVQSPNFRLENLHPLTSEIVTSSVSPSSCAPQMKVTKMLLIVSTVFVCLNLPSCVMRIKTFHETQSLRNEKLTTILQYIFHLLFVTNFGINFLLYCISGQNFRKAVLDMFRSRNRLSISNREGTIQLTGSDVYRNSCVTSTGIMAASTAILDGGITTFLSSKRPSTNNKIISPEFHELQQININKISN